MRVAFGRRRRADLKSGIGRAGALLKEREGSGASQRQARGGVPDFLPEKAGDEIFHGSGPEIADAARGDGQEEKKGGEDDPGCEGGF